jgi:hypothetical protein
MTNLYPHFIAYIAIIGAKCPDANLTKRGGVIASIIQTHLDQNLQGS